MYRSVEARLCVVAMISPMDVACSRHLDCAYATSSGDVALAFTCEVSTSYKQAALVACDDEEVTNYVELAWFLPKRFDAW